MRRLRIHMRRGGGKTSQTLPLRVSLSNSRSLTLALFIITVKGCGFDLTHTKVESVVESQVTIGVGQLCELTESVAEFR